jgi:hypothetical protein
VKLWVSRFRTSLEQLSPEEAALLLSVGLALGVFPIMGCPTAFCLLAALRLRLNVAALQLLNQISSPLQLALLLPLERAGGWLCGSAVSANGSAARQIGVAGLHAVVGWGCICVPAGVLMYFILSMAMRRHQLTPRLSV